MLRLVLMSLLAFCYCQGPPEAKEPKFGAVYDSICPYGEESQKMMDTSEVLIERISDNMAKVGGPLNLMKDLPEKSILSMTVYKVMSGGTEEVYQTFDICDLCKELGDMDSSIRGYLDNFGLPSACPIQSGIYNISGMCFDMNELVAMSSQTVGVYIVQLSFCVATGDNCQQDRECSCDLRVMASVEDMS